MNTLHIRKPQNIKSPASIFIFCFPSPQLRYASFSMTCLHTSSTASSYMFYVAQDYKLLVTYSSPIPSLTTLCANSRSITSIYQLASISTALTCPWILCFTEHSTTHPSPIIKYGPIFPLFTVHFTSIDRR